MKYDGIMNLLRHEIACQLMRLAGSNIGVPYKIQKIDLKKPGAN
jgi:hypothetical protein